MSACTWLLGYLATQLLRPTHGSDPGPKDVAVTRGVKYRRLQPRVHVVYHATVLKKELAPQREPCTEWYHI
jgi:hypothetical protein